MKYILLSSLILSGSILANPMNNQNLLVSVDSLSIMQQSLEGQELATKIQAEIDVFRNELKIAQEEINTMQDTLTKQAKVLSLDTYQEKAADLENKKKKLEREFADKEEALKTSIQRKQIILREKQLGIVNELSTKEGWGVVIDKNTPGVLAISNTIDQTKKVLEAVNLNYTIKSKTTTIAHAPKNSSLDKKTLKAA